MARKKTDDYLESLLASQKSGGEDPDRASTLAAATAEDDQPVRQSPASQPKKAPVPEKTGEAGPAAGTPALVEEIVPAPGPGEEVLFTDEKAEDELPPEVEETEADREALKALKSEGVKFSIRLKLALSITILMVSAMLVLWLIMLSSSSSSLMEQMEYRASIIGRNLAANLKESFEDVMARHPIVAETKKEVADLLKVTVCDLSLNVVDSSDDQIYQDISVRIAEEKPLEPVDATIRPVLQGLTGQKTASLKDAFTIYQPIVNFQGAVQGYVVLDFTKKIILDRITAIKNQSIVIIVGSIVLALVAFFILITLMLAPIKKLIFGVRKIGAGDMRYTIHLKTGDEMEVLGSEFNAMTKKLIKAQREIVEKGKLQEQINIAEDLQKNLLPDHVPELPFFSFDSYYKAARGVGGDYFDILELTDDDMVGVIIADVSGKGVPAAIIMVIIRTIFQSIAKFVNSPEKALDMINKNISGRTSGEKYATMFYYMFNYRTGELVYSNGGHTPLMIYHRKQNEIREYDTPGAPVGVLEESVYSTASMRLEEGDIIILSTDGVTEAGSSKHGFYTEDDLKKGVIKYSNMNAKEIVGNIIKDINDFVGSIPQHDDMTLLVLKVNKIDPAARARPAKAAVQPLQAAMGTMTRQTAAAAPQRPVSAPAARVPTRQVPVMPVPAMPVSAMEIAEQAAEPGVAEFVDEVSAADIFAEPSVQSGQVAGDEGPEASEEVDMSAAFAESPQPAEVVRKPAAVPQPKRSIASLKARLRLLYHHPTDFYNSII